MRRHLALALLGALLSSPVLAAQSTAIVDETLPGAPSIGANGRSMPTVPGTGSALDASGSQPNLSGLNLLGTQAAGTRLGYWFFENESAASLTIALDDGAGGALSVFVLAPGTGAGQQGGSMGWQDTGPHAGRIRVYGPAGSQFALRVQ